MLYCNNDFERAEDPGIMASTTDDLDHSLSLWSAHRNSELYFFPSRLIVGNPPVYPCLHHDRGSKKKLDRFTSLHDAIGRKRHGSTVSTVGF